MNRQLTEEEFNIIDKIMRKSHMYEEFQIVDDGRTTYFEDYGEYSNDTMSVDAGLELVSEGFSDTYNIYNLSSTERQIFIDLLNEFNIELPNDSDLYPQSNIEKD